MKNRKVVRMLKWYKREEMQNSDIMASIQSKMRNLSFGNVKMSRWS